MAGFRALIVDDERLARREMRALLAGHPDVEVVGEAANVADAARQIDGLRPDVIFLDIQLAGETGFDVLPRVPADAKVVFVTAFDEYALRAFDVNALDYLLKPVQEDRLSETLRRLRAGDTGERRASGRLERDDRLFLPVGRHRAFVKVVAIRSIVAEGDYSRLVLDDGRESLVLRSLREWEERLPPRHFLRIHRGAIVNLDAIARVEGSVAEGFTVHLHGADRPFAMSRRYAAQVRERLR